MKLECSIEKFKNAVIQADRITGKNTALPVLGSILIVADNHICKLRATNLSLGIEIEIPAKIEENGVVAVNGSVLSQIFSNIKNEGTVLIEKIDTTLSITTKYAHMSVKTVLEDDFPVIPIVEGDTLALPIKDFNEGLKSVFYSTALSDIKPELASVYIYKEKESDTIVFVATDSFRLAEKKIKISGINDFQSMLIPFKNVIEILRVFQDETNSFDLAITSTQISFTQKELGIYLTSRVIDGTFPDYRLIIPKESTTEVQLLKQDLIQSLKITNVFTDKFNQIILNINQENQVLEITSKNSDIGETDIVIHSKNTGNNLTAGFNYKHFIDCLQSINDDSIILCFTQPNKPMIVKGVNNKTFIYLIMPLNR